MKILNMIKFILKNCGQYQKKYLVEVLFVHEGMSYIYEEMTL